MHTIFHTGSARSLRGMNDARGRFSARSTLCEEWQVVRDASMLNTMLGGRPLCPNAATFGHTIVTGEPNFSLSCCASNLSALQANACVKYQVLHAAASHAAWHLRRLRTLFIGDSLSEQFTHAMLQDLHGRGMLRGASKHTVAWFDVDANADNVIGQYRPFYRKVDFVHHRCHGVPLGTFWPDAPRARRDPTSADRGVIMFHMAGRVCDPQQTAASCCDNGSSARGGQIPLLANMLRVQRPVIVVANFGVHWHYEQLKGGELSKATAALLGTLVAYGKERARDRSALPPLLLFRETFPQHFPTPGGGYESSPGHKWWDDAEAVDMARCTPFRVGPRVGFGPAAFNSVGLAEVRQLRNESAAVRVRMLPAFARYVRRSDAHVDCRAIPRKDCNIRPDCTHWCYSPLLWDAALAPFYDAVNEHFQAATKGTIRAVKDASL